VVPDRQSDFERLVGPDRRRPRYPKGLGAVVLVVGLLIGIGLVVLYPRDLPELDLRGFGFATDMVPATVTDTADLPCSYSPDLTCHLVEFGFDTATATDQSVVQEFATDPGQPTFEAGDRVFLAQVDFDGTVHYQYADRDRRLLLGVVALVFAAAVVGLGRMKGVAALVGLALSIAVLVWFIVPAIIAGTDAVLVVLVGGGAIAMIALYLAHGYTPLTHVAAIGMFSAIALTTALSWIVVTAAQFSGLNSEEAFYLLEIPGFDLSGLLLAGIVLGSIGAMDDVTVTQASAVWEVRKASPDMGATDLYQSGLRVGRDHIASTVNTLLLAYAGASMPLLILFSLSNQPLAIVANSEVVAVEIVRTLVGSIGLVAAVPITTWLASRVAARTTIV